MDWMKIITHSHSGSSEFVHISPQAESGTAALVTRERTAGILINIKTKNEMRYCANVFCERHEFCLRYALGKRWHEENDLLRRGYYRGRRPGSWVAYRNTIEARKCTQFIHINERTR